MEPLLSLWIGSLLTHLSQKAQPLQYTHNGREKCKVKLLEFCQQAVELGAGEIVINSVDRDGEMSGYDLDLAKKVRESVTSPLSILGGAGIFDHIRELIDSVGVIGAAAGSMFVFKGIYRAVLISYPGKDEKDKLFGMMGMRPSH